jgi:hypothetical protein
MEDVKSQPKPTENAEKRKEVEQRRAKPKQFQNPGTEKKG